MHVHLKGTTAAHSRLQEVDVLRGILAPVLRALNVKPKRVVRVRWAVLGPAHTINHDSLTTTT